MTREEYEERRRAFEEVLQADIALVHAAHEARIRSLERLWQAKVEGDGDAALPAASPTAGDPSAAVPKTAARPPDPPPKPARPRGEVLDDLTAALPRLPEVFDKYDVANALGYQPARATLFRALERLRDQGVVAIESYSDGGVVTVYRKAAATG
jgi:hypothetical protein